MEPYLAITSEKSTHLPKMHWAAVSPPIQRQSFEVTSKARRLKINFASLVLTAHHETKCTEPWDQISLMKTQKQKHNVFRFAFMKSFTECKFAILLLVFLGIFNV